MAPWVSEGIKDGIIAAGSAAVIWLWKKARPFYKEVQSFLKTTDEIVAIKREIFLQRKRSQAYLDTASDPIAILDANRDIIYVNAAYMFMTGAPFMDDILGTGYMMLIPKDEQARIEKIREDQKKHTHPYEKDVIFEHFVTKKRIHTLCRTKPIYEEDGKTVIEIIARFTVLENPAIEIAG